MAGKLNCTFCKIAAGEDKNTEIIHSAENVVVFRDIRPAAQHHYLVVSKQHLPDAKQLNHDHLQLVQQMIEAGHQTLHQQGADTTDIRMGFHWPPFHMISHLHLHVISPASQMGWISSFIFRPNSYWFVTADWLEDRLLSMAPDESEEK